MAANDKLHKAKTAKNDEFYTQLTDIEKELVHYRNHFRDKVIFCNCDDPVQSNFWRYFHLNFEFLGLKKLISTHYDTVESTYSMEYDGGNDNNVYDGKVIPLKGNGDFRSDECIKLLKSADIVVTNPPFSLFREYVAQLMEYDKRFIILGNKNCITYKEIFPLIKDNKLWIGTTPMSKDLLFDLPSQYAEQLIANNKCGSGYKIVNGVVKGRSASIWLTNLDHSKRHESMDLIEHYTPEKYPKYDNYDAIEVSKSLDIPIDYDGVMGVPITFMDKYCPEQFEIVGLGNGTELFTPTKMYENAIMHKAGKTSNGNAINRVLVYETTDNASVYYTADNTDKKLFAPYARILIKRKCVFNEDNAQTD